MASSRRFSLIGFSVTLEGPSGSVRGFDSVKSVGFSGLIGLVGSVGFSGFSVGSIVSGSSIVSLGGK